MSYDGTIAKLYIDGALKAASSPGTAITYDSETEKACIGATIATNGFPAQLFDGNIDEVIIFNNALSPEEIHELYLSGV